uniref:Putative secreted peptide n=1 Tax=Anopheles braziliensis TaxID=58242 RepID=A0A2M3ZNI0_9DIPT
MFVLVQLRLRHVVRLQNVQLLSILLGDRRLLISSRFGRFFNIHQNVRQITGTTRVLNIRHNHTRMGCYWMSFWRFQRFRLLRF